MHTLHNWGILLQFMLWNGTSVIIDCDGAWSAIKILYTLMYLL